MLFTYSSNGYPLVIEPFIFSIKRLASMTTITIMLVKAVLLLQYQKIIQHISGAVFQILLRFLFLRTNGNLGGVDWL